MEDIKKIIELALRDIDDDDEEEWDDETKNNWREKMSEQIGFEIAANDAETGKKGIA